MATVDIEYGEMILAEQFGEKVPNGKTVGAKEWEMVLHNSSYGHEYARLEFEETRDLVVREDLLAKMENYKRAYFLARRYLKRQNPERLQIVESELLDQKMKVFGGYTA